MWRRKSLQAKQREFAGIASRLLQKAVSFAFQTAVRLQILVSFFSNCPNSSLDSGGTVHRSDGISRVDSGLAVSRALGDFSYKDAGVADADRKISATPEV